MKDKVSAVGDAYIMLMKPVSLGGLDQFLSVKNWSVVLKNAGKSSVCGFSALHFQSIDLLGIN